MGGMATIINVISSQRKLKQNEHFDAETLNRVDLQTVTVIYDLYYPEVYKYIRYRLGDATLAKDLASEVFVRFLEAFWSKLASISNLHAWLISTANHVVSDHFRLLYHSPVEEMPEEVEVSDPIVDMSRKQLEDEIQKNERKRAFRKAFARLSIQQQHVLALRFGLGFSLEQTAEYMGKNVNSVKSLQFRALESLQRHIEGVK